MAEHSPVTPDVVDAYLDGELLPEQLARFEADRREDPALDRQARRLAELESGLRRMLAAEQAEWPAAARRSVSAARAAGPSGTADRPARPTPPWIRVLGLAAIVAIAVAGVLIYATQSQPARRTLAPLRAAEVYDDVRADFVPTTVCDTHEKFVAYTVERLGVPIAAQLDAAATGVALIGWRQLPVGPGTYGVPVLLARTEAGEQIAVLFQTGPGRREIRDRSGGPEVFTREIDGVTIDEISGLGRPRVLDLLELASEP